MPDKFDKQQYEANVQAKHIRAAKRMQILLDTYGLSSAKFAAGIGIPTEHVTAILNQDLNIPPDVLIGISQKYDIALDYFVEELHENEALDEFCARVLALPSDSRGKMLAFFKDLTQSKTAGEAFVKATAFLQEGNLSPLEVDIIGTIAKEFDPQQPNSGLFKA